MNILHIGCHTLLGIVNFKPYQLDCRLNDDVAVKLCLAACPTTSEFRFHYMCGSNMFSLASFLPHTNVLEILNSLVWKQVLLK